MVRSQKKKHPSPVLRYPSDQRVEKSLELVKAFAAKHGCSAIRGKLVYRRFHLGQWVAVRRIDYRRGDLPDWLRRELERIPGWSWDPTRDQQRQKAKLLRRFVRRYGWQALSSSTEFEDVKLGDWVHRIRLAYAAGRLPSWMPDELESIEGWSWLPKSEQHDGPFPPAQTEAFAILRRYVEKHGWQNFRTWTRWEGVQIAQYAKRWRTAYRRHQLTDEQQRQLESIPGWRWEAAFPREHHRQVMRLLRDYVRQYGWKKVTRKKRVKGINLGSWCASRRAEKRQGKLAKWLVEELESLPGWRWNIER